MATRKNSGKKAGAITIVAAMILLCVAAVVLVESGALAKVSKFTSLKGITSASSLMPGEDSKTKVDNKLHLNIDVPSTGKTGEAESNAGSNADSDTATQTVTIPDGAKSPISVGDALTIAQDMTVATPHPSGYNRKTQFGDWQNSDQLCGYGTTRDYILKRDMTNVTMDSQCRVQTGTLSDPYTGKTVSFQRDVYRTVNGKSTKVSGDSTAVQIDHVVALNDAWASGLWQDSRKNDRVTYANDPEVLLASDGPANNVKSMGINLYGEGVAKSNNGTGGAMKWTASTPSVWLPDNTSYQCEYMAKRVYIKNKYRLTMSSWEKAETVSKLQQCAVN